jgi:16S rRNA (guanine966-N2)-methyltransferase
VAVVGLPGGHIVTGRVERVLARGPGPELAGEPGYDLVVADPPYAAADEDVAAMLAALRDGSWLATGAVVAVERATRSGPVHWPPGYVSDRSRRYGEATFWYGLAAGDQAAKEQ